MEGKFKNSFFRMGVLTKAVKNFDDGDFDAIVVVAPSTKVRVFFVSFQKKLRCGPDRFRRFDVYWIQRNKQSIYLDKLKSFAEFIICKSQLLKCEIKKHVKLVLDYFPSLIEIAFFVSSELCIL